MDRPTPYSAAGTPLSPRRSDRCRPPPAIGATLHSLHRPRLPVAFPRLALHALRHRVLPDHLLDLCVDKLTLCGGLEDLDRVIEHLLEFKAIGVTHMCIELKKHQAHGLKLLGERVLPALQ